MKVMNKKNKGLRITLRRVEGPRKSGVGKTLKFDNFDTAQKCMEVWAKTAPQPGDGYDKCEIVVTLPDGLSWEYRYDLVSDGSEGDGRTVKDNLHQRLRVWAGILCPAHLTQTRYQKLLNAQPNLTKTATLILQRWEETYFKTT